MLFQWYISFRKSINQQVKRWTFKIFMYKMYIQDKWKTIMTSNMK